MHRDVKSIFFLAWQLAFRPFCVWYRTSAMLGNRIQIVYYSASKDIGKRSQTGVGACEVGSEILS